jgi:hypothetical protein
MTSGLIPNAPTESLVSSMSHEKENREKKKKKKQIRVEWPKGIP